MKKSILSVAFIVFAVMITNAQVKFGIKGGLNLSTFTGSDATSTNLPGKATKAGLHIGALAKIKIKSNFTVQPEVYFSMEGVKVTGGTYNLSYINVPVLAKYRFNHSKFSIASGPQVGFVTSANFKPTGGTSTDIKSQIQSMDYAWLVDLDYLTSRNVGFGARYNIGVGTIDKNTPKEHVTNSSFQAYAYFTVGGKKGNIEHKAKKSGHKREK